MYQTVANKLGHGLYIRQDDKFLWINDSFVEMFGYTKEEILTMTGSDLIVHDDWDYLREVDAQFKADEIDGQLSLELRGISKDGHIIDISVIHKRTEFQGKAASIGSVINISERKKMEFALKESQERYQSLVDNSPLAIVVHQKGIIEYANPTALSLLGAESDMIGLPIYSIIHPDFKEIVSERIDNIEKNVGFAPPLYEKFIRLDGREIDVEVKGMPIQLSGIPAVQIVFWDATEKRKEEELAKYRAYYDTLTDLPNHHKFRLDFAEKINNDRTFTIMYLELQGIKQINDSHGRQAGDLVLMKVGARLSGIIGLKGIVYRMGGAEFSVVLPGEKQDNEMRELAEIMTEIVNQPIYINCTTVQVSPSIGVVFYPAHGVELDMLLRHAVMAKMHAQRTKTLFKKYDD